MRVLFAVRSAVPTFAVKDPEHLEALGHEVTTFVYRGARDAPALARETRRHDAAFVWFADAHAAVVARAARRLRRPVVVALAGYEVAQDGTSRPDPLAKLLVNVALKRAHVVLALSEFSAREAAAHLRGLESRVVPLDVDVEQFSPGDEGAQTDDAQARTDVVTTGNVEESTWTLKGLDVFAQTARLLPEVPFRVYGPLLPEYLAKQEVPPNFAAAGLVDWDRLRDAFRASAVYCQLSVRETFGHALAQAMACGCVPVVSDRGALPDTVGAAGLVVPYGDTEATARAIRQAFDEREERGRLAREHVVRLYAPGTRRRGLEEAMKAAEQAAATR